MPVGESVKPLQFLFVSANTFLAHQRRIIYRKKHAFFDSVLLRMLAKNVYGQ